MGGEERKSQCKTRQEKEKCACVCGYAYDQDQGAESNRACRPRIQEKIEQTAFIAL